MKQFQKYTINGNANIRTALKKIDDNGKGFVFIVDEGEKVKGILTDGDFRRAILKGISMKDNCLSIANQNFIYLNSKYSKSDAISSFLKKRLNNIPILENGLLVDIIYRKDFNLSQKIILAKKKENVSVVIMAGGKGTRMKPFTNILPKPLIPIGDKTMLEVIMDEYLLFYNSSFHISVNFKANLIKTYLNDYIDKYQITYIDEDLPLGTGGALKYLEGKIKNPFFVSNCDILIKSNYQKIYKTHIKDCNDLTIVTSMVHYKVPYGVCEINEGGELKSLVEKPEYDFLINSGMYVINPETLKLIPKDTFFNITDLIKLIKVNGGKVGVFPVSEKSYMDSGQWKEYNEMINSLNNYSKKAKI